MTIIALTAAGFLLLAFVLIFRKMNTKSVERMLEKNQNVMPIFKERSAQIKYNNLHDALRNNGPALQILHQLHTDFADKLIDLEIYHQKLDELAGLYPKQ